MQEKEHSFHARAIKPLANFQPQANFTAELQDLRKWEKFWHTSKITAIVKSTTKLNQAKVLKKKIIAKNKDQQGDSK